MDIFLKGKTFQLTGPYKELYQKGKEASWKPLDHQEDHTGQSNPTNSRKEQINQV